MMPMMRRRRAMSAAGSRAFFVLMIRRLVMMRMTRRRQTATSRRARKRLWLIGRKKLRRTIKDDPAGRQCRRRGNGHAVLELLEPAARDGIRTNPTE